MVIDLVDAFGKRVAGRVVKNDSWYCAATSLFHLAWSESCDPYPEIRRPGVISFVPHRGTKRHLLRAAISGCVSVLLDGKRITIAGRSNLMYLLVCEKSR